MAKISPITFWSIFWQYGFEGVGIGDVTHGLRWTIITALVEIIISTASTTSLIYATDLINGEGAENMAHILILTTIGIFSTNAISHIKMATREACMRENTAINKKIWRKVHGLMDSASPEMRAKHNTEEYSMAMDRFIWVYSDVIHTIFQAGLQGAQSIVICTFICYKEPRLLPVIAASYAAIWKYAIPRLMKVRESGDQRLWIPAYYALTEEWKTTDNPRLRWLDNKQKSYIDILGDTIEFYTKAGKERVSTENMIALWQNGISMCLIGALVACSQNTTAFAVLVHRTALFGIITEYINLAGMEQKMASSFEKMAAILADLAVPAPQKQACVGEEKGLTRIKFGGLRIPVGAKFIDVRGMDINMEAGRVVLLEGASGSGKTTILNVFAGLYSGQCATGFEAYFGNTRIATEFNALLNHRVYVTQNVVEDYTLNGCIRQTVEDLFPGAVSMSEVTDFLRDGFRLSESCIPTTLADKPRKGLSGGERQRYVIASQIWKIIKSGVEFVLLDEIERALDVITAVHVVNWILDHVHARFVIVTHLCEVKALLKSRDCVDEVLILAN